MYPTCWTILGIAPTDELRAVKRAYLARLKSIKPDQDIEGFQALRAAYEEAQAQVELSQESFDAGAAVTFEPASARVVPEPAALAQAQQDGVAKADADEHEWRDGFASRREEMSVQVSRLLALADVSAVPGILHQLWSQPRWEVLTLQASLERLLLWRLAECADPGPGAALPEGGDRTQIIAAVLAECSLHYPWFDHGDDHVHQQLGDFLRHVFTRGDPIYDYLVRVRRYLGSQIDITLLQRLARGTEQLDAVPQEIAQALLARRVGWRNWRVSITYDWHQRMFGALIWLSHHAPAALQVVEPKVLAFWSAPRPVKSPAWILSAIACWLLLLTLRDITMSKSLYTSLLLVNLLAGPVVGYYLARGVATLRVHWAVCVYPAWVHFDQRLMQRIPLLKKGWLANQRILPTRHLLPALVVYAIFMAPILAYRSVDATLLLIAVFIAFITMVLLMLLNSFFDLLLASPGAKLWLQFQQALNKHGR